MRPVAHAVPGAVIELLRSSPLSPGKVSFAWRMAVGPALERVTTVRLTGNALVVDAATAEWAREVGRSSGIILSRLQAYLGADAPQRIEARVAGRPLEDQGPRTRDQGL